MTGLFAQHVLLATLDRDRGEPARAAGLAAEVARWARETGAGALERQARELLT